MSTDIESQGRAGSPNLNGGDNHNSGPRCPVWSPMAYSRGSSAPAFFSVHVREALANPWLGFIN